MYGQPNVKQNKDGCTVKRGVRLKDISGAQQLHNGLEVVTLYSGLVAATVHGLSAKLAYGFTRVFSSAHT